QRGSGQRGQQEKADHRQPEARPGGAGDPPGAPAAARARGLAGRDVRLPPPPRGGGGGGGGGGGRSRESEGSAGRPPSVRRWRTRGSTALHRRSVARFTRSTATANTRIAPCSAE